MLFESEVREIKMNPLDAVAVAKLLRQQHGHLAERFIQTRIRYFEAEPSKSGAVAAWRRVEEALNNLDTEAEEVVVNISLRAPRKEKMSAFGKQVRKHGFF